jgi:hypothetical protein
MRVRVAADAVGEFGALVGSLGVEAVAIGDSLELVHPTGRAGTAEELELRFLVRAFEAARGAERGSLVEPLDRQH